VIGIAYVMFTFFSCRLWAMQKQTNCFLFRDDEGISVNLLHCYASIRFRDAMNNRLKLYSLSRAWGSQLILPQRHRQGAMRGVQARLARGGSSLRWSTIRSLYTWTFGSDDDSRDREQRGAHVKIKPNAHRQRAGFWRARQQPARHEISAVLEDYE